MSSVLFATTLLLASALVWGDETCDLPSMSFETLTDSNHLGAMYPDMTSKELSELEDAIEIIDTDSNGCVTTEETRAFCTNDADSSYDDICEIVCTAMGTYVNGECQSKVTNPTGGTTSSCTDASAIPAEQMLEHLMDVYPDMTDEEMVEFEDMVVELDSNGDACISGTEAQSFCAEQTDSSYEDICTDICTELTGYDGTCTIQAGASNNIDCKTGTEQSDTILANVEGYVGYMLSGNDLDAFNDIMDAIDDGSSISLCVSIESLSKYCTSADDDGDVGDMCKNIQGYIQTGGNGGSGSATSGTSSLSCSNGVTSDQMLAVIQQTETMSDSDVDIFEEIFESIDGSSDNDGCLSGTEALDFCVTAGNSYTDVCDMLCDVFGDGTYACGGKGDALTCTSGGGIYCGSDESNWTLYVQDGCVQEEFHCDGYNDCVDGVDEQGC